MKFFENRNQKGFTLMEMLIVVAIIAILVAIAIPVFNNQLEKSREAADAANIRAEYATIMMDYLDDSVSGDYDVELTQKEDDWQTDLIKDKGIANITFAGDLKAEGKCTLTINDDGEVTGTFSE